jgi:hypothetical protein
MGRCLGKCRDGACGQERGAGNSLSADIVKHA